MRKIPCQIAVYRTYGKRFGCRYEWNVFIEDGKGNLKLSLSNYTFTKWGAIIQAFVKAGLLSVRRTSKSVKVFEYDNRGNHV